MLSLEQKLISTSRYATLNDFKVGLEYEEIQPYHEGKITHKFYPRKVSRETFLDDARTFYQLVSNNQALVPDGKEHSEDWIAAKEKIMQTEDYKKLHNYPDSK